MNQPAGQPNNRSGSLLVAGVFGIPIFGLLSLIGGRKPARTIFLRLLAVIAICLAGWQVMGCGGSFSGIDHDQRWQNTSGRLQHSCSGHRKRWQHLSGGYQAERHSVSI